jgi:NAD+ kinase
VKPLKSVLLLTDPVDERVSEEAVALQSWLAERGVEVQKVPTQPEGAKCAPMDLGIVLGGDGTFLRASRCLENHSMPLIGMRFGSFGYLAELERDHWQEPLQRLLAGEGSIESWLRLRVRLRRPGQDWIDLGMVLNEVVVTAERIARIVEVGLRIDGEDITRYRGDGVIVATPVGSTAHSLAAGGPIVESTDRNILLTPLASHAMTYRPLVLRPRRSVEMVVLAGRHGTALTIDGQQTLALEEGTLVQLGDAGRDLQVATVVERSRFRTLRERLHWGAPLFEPPVKTLGGGAETAT